MSNALVGRYYLISMQMTLGLAGLLPILICHRADGSPRKNQRVGLAIAGAVFVSGIFYALAGWQSGINQSHKYSRALARREMALSLWREAPFISPLPTSHPVVPPRLRTQYLAMVQAGLCPDNSRGWWLTKALKDALSRDPVGKVKLTGRGEN
jgi:hypothetical protein